MKPLAVIPISKDPYAQPLTAFQHATDEAIVLRVGGAGAPCTIRLDRKAASELGHVLDAWVASTAAEAARREAHARATGDPEPEAADDEASDDDAPSSDTPEPV